MTFVVLFIVHRMFPDVFDADFVNHINQLLLQAHAQAAQPNNQPQRPLPQGQAVQQNNPPQGPILQGQPIPNPQRPPLRRGTKTELCLKL